MEDFIRNSHNFDKEAQFFDESDETTHQLASLMNLDPNSQTGNEQIIDKGVVFVQNGEIEDAQITKNMISATDNNSSLGTNASQLPENDKKEVEIQKQAIINQQTAEGHYLITNNIHLNEEGQKQSQTAEVANISVENPKKPDDEDNLDYVEGFQIFSDNMPVDVSKLPTGPDAMQIEHEFEVPSSSSNNLTPQKRQRGRPLGSQKKPSSILVPAGPKTPPRKNAFGPHTIKEAIVSLGGRATGMQIVDWIAQNKPEFHTAFESDRKKLRYSIIGILSAKSYSTAFRKEVYTQNGIKKSDWILGDPSAVPEPVEGSDIPLEGLSIANPASNANINEAEHAADIEAELAKKICQICNLGEDDDKLLLCDGCDLGFHMYCLKPPLDTIPEGTWFCEKCIQIVAKRERGAHSDTEVDEEYTQEDGDTDENMELAPDDSLIEGEIPEGESVEGSIVSPRACDKHRRWKKRCPPDCPMRAKLKPGTKFGRRLRIAAAKRARAAQKSDTVPMLPPPEVPLEQIDTTASISEISVIPSKKQKIKDTTSGESGPTYIEMIADAINSLGGQGTTPEITNIMETKYGELLQMKTKTWRNSVSGTLSTHFTRGPKDNLGRVVWKIREDNSLTPPKVDGSRSPDDKERKRRGRPPKAKVMEPTPSHVSNSQIISNATPTTYNNVVSQIPPTFTPSTPPSGSLKVRSESSSEITSLKAPPKSVQKMFDPTKMEELRKTSDENKEFQGILLINRVNPMEVGPKLNHPGAIYNICWSNDGNYLASVSLFGNIRIWKSDDFSLVQDIRDKEEFNMDQFYNVVWSRDDRKIFVAGKLMDKKKWNPILNDHETLASPIKIFDVHTGKLIHKLEGHNDEVLSIKRVTFERKQYIISGGKDGQIIKWQMSDDLSSLVKKSVIADVGTSIAGDIEFVPNTGNKYFVACCDGGIKLFDFETDQMVQSFPEIYGYLCDCARFVDAVEMKLPNLEYFLITRGVELADEDGNHKPSACHLHKLTLPQNGRGKARFETVKTYTHKDYDGNVWMLNISSNGRYILAPTIEGKVFVWNLRSAELVAILNDHQDKEVRSVLFHPTKSILVTSADDSMIQVYTQQKKTPTPVKEETSAPLKNESTDPAPPVIADPED